MGLFKKQDETISISSTDQDSAMSLYEKIKLTKLKHTTISGLMSNGETYEFSIQCEDADVIRSSILFLIYEFEDPGVFELILQFNDKTGKAKFYPKEVMTSFRFDSGRLFGSEDEQDFVTKLKKAVSAESNAAVDYVIMSGGAITISIPSTKPEKIQTMLTDLFESYLITLFEIKIISRESM
jgi:hypothetical protein